MISRNCHRLSPSWRSFVPLLLLIPIVRSRPWANSKAPLISLRGGDYVPKKNYRVIQVQVAHRHGDRTPITPLKDEEFWASTLVAPELLSKISEGTKIIRREALEHKANGRGAFGKLTQLGLLQMVEVGSKLREELWSDTDSVVRPDNNGNLYHAHIWEPSRPLHPKDIRILSTDFPRTIQSVQGLLVGFFPDGLEETMEIDCQHTNWMIPDPQPRRSKEQEELEIQMASRPHMLEREKLLIPLAARCTDAVRPLLGHGAFDMAFGVGEDSNSEGPNRSKVLPWAQLAEITKCLSVRNRMPESIAKEDQEALSGHLAWRWFESLQNPRLSYLAMHKFAHNILHTMKQYESEPPLTIYSAHDSTLIGLMCAFRLEQPTVWPEYGSFLKMELLEVTIADDSSNDEKGHVVRFYLNGQLLRSQWEGELREEIPLEELTHYISTEGAVKTE